MFELGRHRMLTYLIVKEIINEIDTDMCPFHESVGVTGLF